MRRVSSSLMLASGMISRVALVYFLASIFVVGVDVIYSDWAPTSESFLSPLLLRFQLRSDVEELKVSRPDWISFDLVQFPINS